MLNVPMSMVKLLSERTSGVPPVIFSIAIFDFVRGRNFLGSTQQGSIPLIPLPSSSSESLPRCKAAKTKQCVCDSGFEDICRVFFMPKNQTGNHLFTDSFITLKLSTFSYHLTTSEPFLECVLLLEYDCAPVSCMGFCT